jgi:hypothetical protein
MQKEKNPLTIKEVNAATFDAFAGLIDKLAEYEKLSPPDPEAKKLVRQAQVPSVCGRNRRQMRLVRDLFFLLTIHVFLLCRRSFLRVFLFLKSTEGRC